MCIKPLFELLVSGVQVTPQNTVPFLLGVGVGLPEGSSTCCTKAEG